MYKPVISFAAPAATFATIAILPKINVAPVTLFAVVLALAMAAWAYVYLLRMKGNMPRV